MTEEHKQTTGFKCSKMGIGKIKRMPPTAEEREEKKKEKKNKKTEHHHSSKTFSMETSNSHTAHSA